MSHFLAYRGKKIELSKLLHLPKESLICTTINEHKKPIQSDGFGIGWYNKNVNPHPAIFKSIRTPLNDDNLINISETIESDCMFLHQLNIDQSYSAQQVNCQPFKFNQLMYMHIGNMSTFHLSKKDLIKQISTQAFDSIKGHSVSEYIFAFILSQLPLKQEKFSQKELEEALLTSVDKLTKLCRKIDRRYHLSLNIVMSDYDHFIAMRFMDDFKEKAAPMYYTFGDRIDIENGEMIIKKKTIREQFVMISSKKLTPNEDEWVEIPENHIVSVNTLNKVTTRAII